MLRMHLCVMKKNFAFVKLNISLSLIVLEINTYAYSFLHRGMYRTLINAYNRQPNFIGELDVKSGQLLIFLN